MSVEVANTPNIRNVREVSITAVDLIVTIGGIFGIFFGMTILAVVEIMFLFYKTMVG